MIIISMKDARYSINKCDTNRYIAYRKYAKFIHIDAQISKTKISQEQGKLFIGEK